VVGTKVVLNHIDIKPMSLHLSSSDGRPKSVHLEPMDDVSPWKERGMMYLVVSRGQSNYKYSIIDQDRRSASAIMPLA
jgi:hypothetical protein